MLLLSALLSLVGLASAAVCTLDADEIDGSGQLNSTCRAHTPQLLVGTAPSTRFAWSSTVEDEMDLYVGEEGTGVLRIEGFGGADWAGGYLQLKAGDVDDPSFQIATLTAERGTDNKTIFSAQKRDVDGGYKGQLFNYLDDQGWKFYTAPSGTSGSQQQAMQIEQGGRMRIKMQDFSSAPSASNGGTQIADSHSGNIILSSGSGTTLANLQLFFNGNGLVGKIFTQGSSTSYATSSDHRLKQGIEPLGGALDRLGQLLPKRFNFKAEPAADKVDGFLAHEVQRVVPNAVSGRKDELDQRGDPVYQAVDHSKLVPLLVAALQEANAKIEQAHAHIGALEARLTAAGI